MSSKNGRFHPLKKDMASPSSSLFDIIITIVVVLIIVIVISKIIIIINAIGVRHLSCPLSTYDYAASSDACAVMSKVQKYCICLCRVKQAPSHNFWVTDRRPDEARHLKSSESIYKIDLKNKIFIAYQRDVCSSATKSLSRISLFLVKWALV